MDANFEKKKLNHIKVLLLYKKGKKGNGNGNGNGDLKLGNEGRRFSRLMSRALAGEFCPKIFLFFF